ncbi:MAG: SDR family oxidoreductase, partial [Halioglobus sp.]|nr:SDR family oxidoreductase [Halioglobus sp.]
MKSAEGKLEGRRILITGAASGMGRATAELFAREGATLALLDKNGPEVEKLAAQLQGFGFECDISSWQQVHHRVERAIEACGGLDGVVNAAGMYCNRPFAEIDVECWNQVMAVNVNGPYHVLRAALAALRAAPAATIVNIASVSGYLPMPGTSVYSASKAAVIMLTKSLGCELGPNIRVNAICPGVIQTEMTRHIWEDPERVQSTA